MANLNVSSQELDAILGELESDLNGILADTQTRLAKAREEDGSPSPGMGSASASPSASAGGSPAPEGSPEGAPPAGASPDASAGAPPAGDPGMEGAPPAGMEGAPEGAPPAGAPGEGGGEGLDPQALEAEYAQLPLEELKAHYLAAKAALFAQMQGGAGAGPEAGAPAGAPPAGPEASAGAGAPPAGAAPAGSPTPEEGQPPMAMSEGKAVAGVSQSGNGGQKVGVAKSEVDVLQDQVDALTKIVTAFVNKPMRKAVTGATYVAKSEEAAPKKPMSATEVTAKLSELTRDPSLKKSDRDAINRFYEGTVKIDAIEHLLK